MCTSSKCLCAGIQIRLHSSNSATCCPCKAAYFTLNWQNQLESIKQARAHTHARAQHTVLFGCRRFSSSPRHKHDVELLYFLYDRVLKGFTVAGTIFTAPESMPPSLAGVFVYARAETNRAEQKEMLFPACTRSFGCSVATQSSVQSNYNIFHHLSCFSPCFLFCTCIDSLQPVICCFAWSRSCSQPCGCDPRQCGSAGRLSSGRSQHYLPTAPRVRLHRQQAGRQVNTATPRASSYWGCQC